MRRFFLFCLVLTAVFAAPGFSRADPHPAQPPPGERPPEVPPATPTKNAPGSPADANPFANVPDSYLAEADSVRSYCEGRDALAQYYNCDCMGFEYLEARIKSPKATRNSLMLSINRKCRDASEASGGVYKQCVGNGPLMPMHIPLEKYCQCVANVFGRLSEGQTLAPDSTSFVDNESRALTACHDTDAAAKMFPQKPDVPKARQ